jgi:hypothetical protein
MFRYGPLPFEGRGRMRWIQPRTNTRTWLVPVVVVVVVVAIRAACGSAGRLGAVRNLTLGWIDAVDMQRT